MEEGVIVMACGGGGMPVYIEDDGTYEGVDGVVDKDHASSVLAREVGADEFIILTEVDKVALDFNKPGQRFLDRLTVAEARQYLAEGHFAKGSMERKIRAILQYLERGGREALITDPANIERALAGETGTRIVR